VSACDAAAIGRVTLSIFSLRKYERESPSYFGIVSYPPSSSLLPFLRGFIFREKRSFILVPFTGNRRRHPFESFLLRVKRAFRAARAAPWPASPPASSLKAFSAHPLANHMEWTISAQKLS